MPHPELARRLGTSDAVVIGLGSMLGAGVFAAFTPAAEAAGTGLLIGLAIAAAVAFCNATSSAQLAAEYPTSGGSYVYGRERLGHGWGFVAGWGFVIGKTASCAAMALTFGSYVAPEGWDRLAALVVVLLLAAVACRGISRTARLTRLSVVVVLLVLAVVVVAACAAGPGAGPGRLSTGLLDSGWHGILQSAGLLFFAFAGYARIATLGEEVVEPRRTIPRAITISLVLALAVYAAVAVALLAVLGPSGIAGTPDPLASAVGSGSWSWAEPLVRFGAATAALGALLGLLTGVSRTVLAMARNGDLPRVLAAVHPQHRVPHRAQLLQAAAVCVLLLTIDVRGAIGFSSFGVLAYYLVANLAALTQTDRRYPKAMQVVGAAGCLLLIAALPFMSVLLGAAVLAVGVAGRRALSPYRRV